WSRSFAEVVKDRKIIGVIDQNNDGGLLPRKQWGLLRRALATVALKVVDENPGPPPDCSDASWYQGNVKLIACEDERSAALPSRPRARVWLLSEPSEPEAIRSLLTRFNPKLPTEGWKVVKVEKNERVTMNVGILLNQTCQEPLAALQNRVKYGFDKVQLRIYDTDKLAAENLAACASYEPPSDDEMEYEEALHTGYVSTDSELAENLNLSSFLLKTLEKLIDTHIRLTTSPSLLSNAQHAYRKGRSTDTSLHSLVSCIERVFRNKEYSLVAFLDIEGAFSNVTPKAITGAMTPLGI
ncbi:hypothetical protein KR084_011486, partial [Drosophila pseudotakahashii]